MKAPAKHARAQAANRDSRDLRQMYLLSQAIENSVDLVALADPDGKFVLANQAFLQALGYSEAEVLGKHFGMVMSANNPPAFLEEFGARIYEAGGWKGECLVTRRDRTDLVISLHCGPVRDKEGNLLGLFGISQDISRQKEAAEHLRRTEEQFRQLADNIREVFFVLSVDPVRTDYISPAYEEIWGRSRRELTERPSAWIDNVHPDDRPGVGSFFEESLRGSQSQREYRVVRPDGSIRWIDARAFPVRDAAGKLVRIVGIAEDITTRKEALDQLHVALAAAKQQAQGMARLTELLDILQSCQTNDEAYKIVGDSLPGVLSARSGALCITSSSRNVVEAVVSWGEAPGTEKVFPPDDCWALRRGKMHRVWNSAPSLRCKHVTAAPRDGYLCFPLAAQGETLGVLYVECAPPAAPAAQEPDENSLEPLARQAVAVGERLSLALANLRLREVLRGQSLRDPLTGLFNRRFMEETLERELRRALRNHHAVALLMMDIDHFKRFNDTFGHQAGDALLRALGDLFTKRTRGQDAACRYGGEEFAVVLSGANVEAARKRAAALREDVKQLNIEFAGQLLGAVTLSIGIAGFPEHATAEELVRAADQALYRAKTEGRDRVIVG